MFSTPVLFLIFNRVDTTRNVFAEIRKVKPKILFIAADGPRFGKHDEKTKCEYVRNYVLQGIDWPCDVKTLFREQNLGCGKAVSEAITWFFNHVEEGIILEDDTVPNTSFFSFCSRMLQHHKNDANIMHISGVNFQFGRKRGEFSYYYSKYFHIWGWATWRRAWERYDFDMQRWNDFRQDSRLKQIVKTQTEFLYWDSLFDKVQKKLIDTWDYQWLFCIWLNNGICITPNKNMISNIGIGQDATHNIPNIHLFFLKTEKINHITHPVNLTIDEKADFFTYRKAINQAPNFLNSLRSKISAASPPIVKHIIKKCIWA